MLSRDCGDRVAFPTRRPGKSAGRRRRQVVERERTSTSGPLRRERQVAPSIGSGARELDLRDRLPGRRETCPRETQYFAGRAGAVTPHRPDGALAGEGVGAGEE